MVAGQVARWKKVVADAQHPSAVSVSRAWRRSRPRSQRCAVPFRYTCAHQPLALKPEHLVFSPQPEGSPEGYSRLLAG